MQTKIEKRWAARVDARSWSKRSINMTNLLIIRSGEIEYGADRLGHPNDVTYHSRIIQALVDDKARKAKDQLYNPGERRDQLRYSKLRLLEAMKQRMTT